MDDDEAINHYKMISEAEDFFWYSCSQDADLMWKDKSDPDTALIDNPSWGSPGVYRFAFAKIDADKRDALLAWFRGLLDKTSADAARIIRGCGCQSSPAPQDVKTFLEDIVSALALFKPVSQ